MSLKPKFTWVVALEEFSSFWRKLELATFLTLFIELPTELLKELDYDSSVVEIQVNFNELPAVNITYNIKNLLKSYCLLKRRWGLSRETNPLRVGMHTVVLLSKSTKIYWSWFHLHSCHLSATNISWSHWRGLILYWRPSSGRVTLIKYHLKHVWGWILSWVVGCSGLVWISATALISWHFFFLIIIINNEIKFQYTSPTITRGGDWLIWTKEIRGENFS